jgi:hypothetical protein
MSSGVEDETPSVKAPHWWAFSGRASLASFGARNWMPKRFATSTTFSAPTRSSSGTK